jgi:hypothetical protein
MIGEDRELRTTSKFQPPQHLEQMSTFIALNLNVNIINIFPVDAVQLTAHGNVMLLKYRRDATRAHSVNEANSSGTMRPLQF